MTQQTGIGLAIEVGASIGDAIARDVIADGMSVEWTGLDPQDGDRLTAVGIEPDTHLWEVAEHAAQAAYRLAMRQAVQP